METFEELITLGEEARDRAHAPYSGFAVGAAIRAKSGRVYTGCNVENACYGLTACAERVAVFSAVAAGERQFDALAVVSETLAPPCGACRQVLVEFGLDIQVIVADVAGGRQLYSVRDLLPVAFTPEFLPCSKVR